jgi:hypothetical protein
LIERLIAVARGDAAPDLVISGARVLSVFTREWLEVDVAVAGGRIAGLGAYDGGERVDARGRWLVPGRPRSSPTRTRWRTYSDSRAWSGCSRHPRGFRSTYS